MDVLLVNGEFVPVTEAATPATDSGLLLGEGVFETIRVEGGQLLFAREHFARLARGARVLEIPFHLEVDELLAQCEQVIDANSLVDARLRVTLTGGPMRRQPISEREGEPTLIISATGFDPARIDADRARGWRILLNRFPINHHSPLSTIKSTCYAEYLLARRWAVANGFDEALLLNTDGRIAETAMANIFAVAGTELRTPDLAEGPLPGVIRGQLLKLAPSIGLVPAEGSMTVEELTACDEVFATNSLIEVMPVVGIGERAVGSGQPGPRTRALHAALRQRVRDALAGRPG